MAASKPAISKVVLFAVAFIVNLIWELSQMFAFQSTPGSDLVGALFFCSLASLVDAGTTVAIYSFLIFVMNPTGKIFYFSAAILGALCAVVFEWFAFRFNLWSYGQQMIVLPIIDIGLLPLVQLTFLVPLSIWMSKHLVRFNFRNA